MACGPSIRAAENETAGPGATATDGGRPDELAVTRLYDAEQEDAEHSEGLHLQASKMVEQMSKMAAS